MNPIEGTSREANGVSLREDHWGQAPIALETTASQCVFEISNEVCNAPMDDSASEDVDVTKCENCKLLLSWNRQLTNKVLSMQEALKSRKKQVFLSKRKGMFYRDSLPNITTIVFLGLFIII